MCLIIVKGRGADVDHTAPPTTGTGRTRATARSKQFDFEVTPDTTVSAIRNMLYEKTKLSPLSQRLFYRNKEVEPTDTLRSLGVLMDEHFELEEAAEVVDLVDVDDEEGFGGTALIGRIGEFRCVAG
jgi:hypothetical protein